MCLRAFRPHRNGEADSIPLPQGSEPLCNDHTMMNKDQDSIIVGFNPAASLNSFTVPSCFIFLLIECVEK